MNLRTGFLYKVASNVRELQSPLRLHEVNVLLEYADYANKDRQLPPLASKLPLLNAKVLFFVLRVKKISLSFVWPLHGKEGKALCSFVYWWNGKFANVF